MFGKKPCRNCATDATVDPVRIAHFNIGPVAARIAPGGAQRYKSRSHLHRHAGCRITTAGSFFLLPELHRHGQARQQLLAVGLGACAAVEKVDGAAVAWTAHQAPNILL